MNYIIVFFAGLLVGGALVYHDTRQAAPDSVSILGGVVGAAPSAVEGDAVPLVVNTQGYVYAVCVERKP